MFQYDEGLYGIMAFLNGKHVGWILTTTNNKWTFQLRAEKTDEPKYDTEELAKEALEKKVEADYVAEKTT